ncbi:MAG: hypothetical protein KC618_00085 [Candidatus Omnitrophica bacterium]|nr:hypothetical protein [Candidatus Omnitrophota bacterium]
MWLRKMRIRGKKGQNIIEYAMIATVVTAAVVAMSTYVFRSVQATQQEIQEEFRKEQ